MAPPIDPPSSSDVGERKDSTQILEEDDPARTVGGGDGDVEATITIQESGMTAIEGDIL